MNTASQKFVLEVYANRVLFTREAKANLLDTTVIYLTEVEEIKITLKKHLHSAYVKIIMHEWMSPGVCLHVINMHICCCKHLADSYATEFSWSFTPNRTRKKTIKRFVSELMVSHA